MFGSIASVVSAAAVNAMAYHKAEAELMSHMTQEQKESYIERRKQQEDLSLRRREVEALEKRADSGFGFGAVFLAFLFGSSLNLLYYNLEIGND